MGDVLSAQCGRCGLKKELHAGGGMMDCSLEVMLDALPEEERAVLAGAFREGAKWPSIDRRPGRCENCGELYARPVVRYTLGGAEHTLAGRCPSCASGRFQPLDGAEVTRCPGCGGVMRVQKTGFWD